MSSTAHLRQASLPFASFVFNEVRLDAHRIVVPTSHRLTSIAGRFQPVAQLPPAISIEAPAGTCVMFDKRMLHGTGTPCLLASNHGLLIRALSTRACPGVNQTDEKRQ